jgi:nitrite reductase (NADH) large subunit
VICVDSGYQVSIGGAAGMDVRETELLVQVATEEEAIEVIKAVTQLYRENAKYLDRIYKWMNKVGLDWIKERVEAETPALVERFEISQSIYRKDPWAEHVQTKARGYQPLANLSLEAAE